MSIHIVDDSGLCLPGSSYGPPPVKKTSNSIKAAFLFAELKKMFEDEIGRLEKENIQHAATIEKNQERVSVLKSTLSSYVVFYRDEEE